MTETGRSTSGVRRVESSEIGVGHVLYYLGQPHQITSIAPHSIQHGWRMAYANGGWSVALIPGQSWWVQSDDVRSQS